MNEEPKIPEIKQPVVPIKPAAKPAVKPADKIPEPIKPSDVTPIAGPPFKPGDPGVTVRSGSRPMTVGDFAQFIASVPKEWLPTLLVKLANRCLSEKVFATGKELADAIVGASKVK